MAKRRSAKSSRKQRKVSRERSERAKKHGLPAKEPTKARAASVDDIGIPSPRGRRERTASEARQPESGDSTEMTLRERVAKLPQGVQLAIVAGVVLLVVVVAAQFRSGKKSSESVGVPSPSQAAPVDELVGPVSSALEQGVPTAADAPDGFELGDAAAEADGGSTATEQPELSPNQPPLAPHPLASTRPVASGPSVPPASQPVSPTPAPVPTPVPVVPRVTHPVAPTPQDNPY